MSGVFPPAVLHPGFQHVTLACYLYLGRCFQLYNAFIFVSFFSFLSFHTFRLEWEARLNRAHATGDGAPCKIFPEQSASAVISSREQHEGKYLNLWEHFTAFALLRLTYSTYTIWNTEAKQHHDNITSLGYLWVL